MPNIWFFKEKKKTKLILFYSSTLGREYREYNFWALPGNSNQAVKRFQSLSKDLCARPIRRGEKGISKVGKKNGKMESLQKAWPGGQALPKPCPAETYLQPLPPNERPPNLSAPWKKQLSGSVKKTWEMESDCFQSLLAPIPKLPGRLFSPQCKT